MLCLLFCVVNTLTFFMLSNLINKHLLLLLVKTIVTFEVFYVCQKPSLKA